MSEEFIEPLDTVNDIKLNGVKIRDTIGGTGLVSCTFSADITLATQIEFAYLDPGFDLTKKKVKFKIGDAATFQGYTFQVSRIAISEQAYEPLVTVALRSDSIRKLKEAQGKFSIQNSSPTMYIAQACKKLGINTVLQQSPKRNTISRDVPKKGEAKDMDPEAADNELSDWTTFGRLSQETGYSMFENAGTIYFGQPEWLIKLDKSPLTVTYGAYAFNHATGKKARAFNVPDCSASIDSKVSDVTVRLSPHWYKQVQPGQALILAGIPGFADTFLVNSVNYDMLGTKSIEVSARTPINKKPEKGPFSDGSKLI